MLIFRMIIVSICLTSLCAYSTATPAKPDTSENPPGALIWDFEKKMKRPKESSGSRLNQLKSFKKIIPRDDTGLITNIFNQGIPLKPRELSKVIYRGISPQESHSSKLRTAKNRSLRPSTKASAFALESTAPTSTHATQKPTSITWTLAEYHPDKLVTSWQSIPGREAGLLWWKTLYLTEVRHTVTIKPSIDNLSLSNFVIATEVRERPNENYPWEAGNAEAGRASQNTFKHVVLLAIQNELILRYPQLKP
jgi:hypothetical protein